MKAFITGSHAYGTPTPDSDVDMVVMIDPGIVHLLAGIGQAGSFTEDGTIAIRFGKLDLICCTKEETYAEWVTGTTLLRQRLPVTREEAVACFEEIRANRTTKVEQPGDFFNDPFIEPTEKDV